MPSAGDDRELHVSLPALVRFVRSLALWCALVAAPIALAAYVLSSRSEPVYRSVAIIVGPKRSLDITTVTDEPVAVIPLDARAYTAALHREDVLRSLWRLLASPGLVAQEPTSEELARLSGSLWLDVDDDRLSVLMYVEATATDPSLARATASAAAASLIAWDDRRAEEAAGRMVETLETQQAALLAQLEHLTALGDRASLAQTVSIAQLLSENRQELALARSQAAAARGALDLVQDAVSVAQVSPRPLLDAAVSAVLCGLLIAVVLMVRSATRKNFLDPESLGAATGLPLLASFTTAPYVGVEAELAAPEPLGARPSSRRRAPLAARRRDPAAGARAVGSPARASTQAALQFLKAHVDRALPHGGRLLVVGITAGDGARPVAAALAAKYRIRPDLGDRVRVATAPALLAAASAVEEAAAADATVLVADPKNLSRDDLDRALEWLLLAGAKVLGIVTSPGRDGRSLPVGLDEA